MPFSIPALPAVPQYISAVKNENKAVANWQKTNVQSQHDLAAFSSQAPSVKTPAALLRNYKVLSVVLGAYGMSSAVKETAVLNSLMTQDPTSPKSLARRSGNASWQAFAKDFANWKNGSPLSSPKLRAAITQNYLTNSYENAVQAQTPGLGDALYFTRTVRAGATLNTIMADPKLLKVAETVSGFDPKQFGALDYDQQVALLKPKLDLKRFSTPEGVQQFAKQYLVMLQMHPQTSKAPASMLTLYGTDTTQSGIVSLFTGNLSGSSSLTAGLYSALY